MCAALSAAKFDKNYNSLNKHYKYKLFRHNLFVINKQKKTT